MAAPETATATRPAPTLDPALLAAPAPPTTRLLALDVFRGMTVAGMLLVNNPGSWGAIYPPLEHAPWNGWTPTDLIFPFFLFIAGVTTHLSLSVRRARGDDDAALQRQILRRGALIVLFGLLVASFPYTPITRFTHIRFPGVLQRIGVAYACAALLTQIVVEVARPSPNSQLLLMAKYSSFPRENSLMAFFGIADEVSAGTLEKFSDQS